MTYLILGIIGVTILFALGRLLRGGANVATWTQHAMHTGNLELLVEHIEARATDDRATAWDQAISALWAAYHREIAARLIVEGAARSDAPILQYWIRRVLDVEPELAETHFSEEFLRQHYRPDVAAQCGRSCGCG